MEWFPKSQSKKKTCSIFLLPDLEYRFILCFFFRSLPIQASLMLYLNQCVVPKAIQKISLQQERKLYFYVNWAIIGRCSWTLPNILLHWLIEWIARRKVKERIRDLLGSICELIELPRIHCWCLNCQLGKSCHYTSLISYYAYYADIIAVISWHLFSV